MLTDTLTEGPANRAIVLENVRCAYCGSFLDAVPHSKEHVIGRRFVPKGSLDGNWNLILRACVPCNKRKADLEDDISAITMYQEVWRAGDKADRTLRREAARKARKSLSRKTGKPVGESLEKWHASMPFLGAGTMTFSGMAPPQIASERIYELARLHIWGFFHWITFSGERKTGGYHLGEFFPILEASRSDWGNEVHLAFMNVVLTWEPRVFAGSAEGYFKVVIRKHPTETLWSWAIEWNKSLRVVGLMGEKAAALGVADALPALMAHTIMESPTSLIRYRTEKLIAKDDDVLFQWQDTRLI